jgi:hypothetical protein
MPHVLHLQGHQTTPFCTPSKVYPSSLAQSTGPSHGLFLSPEASCLAICFQTATLEVGTQAEQLEVETQAEQFEVETQAE